MFGYVNEIIVIISINIILAVSLNFINGVAGQFSLGHAGFMAVGAYVSAILAGTYDLNIYIAMLLGAVMAGVVGMLIGFPVLRLRGDYLAIVTLGFGEVIRLLIRNIDFTVGKTITGGASGLKGIPKIRGAELILLAILLVLLTILVLKHIAESSEGRALISLREDEIASEAMGVNTSYYKLLAFIVGSFFAGLAGALYAHQRGFLDTNNFDLFKTVDILLMIVIGGLGSLSGAIFGAVILTIISEMMRGFSEYRMIVYSVILVALMLIRPKGIFGKTEIWDLLKKKKKGA